MKLKVQEVISVPDGKYSGTIIGVEYRDKPYEYVDVVLDFELEGNRRTLRAGFPQYLSPNSKLGALLDRFGAKLTFGEDLDPEEILIGKPSSFMVVNKKTEKGEFPNVLPESVKPQ